MTKLIVTDMDGTLLDDHRNLPADIWKVIDQLHQKDILFAVASGRQFQTLADIFEPVKDKMLFMAENGTIVVHKSEVISIMALDKALVHEFIGIARGLDDCHIVLCGAETAFVESTDERFLNKTRDYFHHIEIVEDLMTVDADVLKFTVCDFKNPENYSFKFFEPFSDRCKPAIASEVWLDVMPLEANKGAALQKMQQKLGIENTETLVFGDYMNDFEMMQYSVNSYAMVNAHPEILAISKFRTRLDNNHNGVVETLRELGLVQ
ncbi:HAD family phosphatase [Flavobacterium sp. MAH-1]|uniref:HAD family phosphatase n=1 Tax=Flavobacterium agri TaxID=2743471 RepID=A0A7Y8Y2A0_9FLAO|nr:HAD family hydrolase [Flavobacterium agri]NUY81178.1 HAD family phosphatase [Flavobacterium agri]NYA71202.1 HAD family phosphatase [Flavobacterium agri]